MSEQVRPYGGRVSINELVRAVLPELVEARQAEGLARYGQELRSWNGRDPFQDLVEEQLDGLQYAIQAQVEHQDVVRVLRVLARFHAAAGTRAFSVLDEELMAIWDEAQAAVGTLPLEVVFPELGKEAGDAGAPGA